WWGDDVASLRAFDLDSQRSGEAIERITVLPVRTEGRTAGGGVEPAAPLPRQSLLDLLPSDSVIVLEQESALEQEADRAWAAAAPAALSRGGRQRGDPGPPGWGLRGPSRARHRDLPWHPDHRGWGGRWQPRGRRSRVRRRRPPQRAAVSPRPARAVPGGGRRRGAATAAAPAGRDDVAAATRQGAGGDS